MIAQHQIGHLTEAQMLVVCGRREDEVFAKFDLDEKGLYFNERLEFEINKRKAYCGGRGKNLEGKAKEKVKQTTVEPQIENKPKLKGGKSISIGNREFDGALSEWLMQNKEAAVEQILMQYPKLKKVDVFRQIDSETVQYHFKDENHAYNYFKSACKKLSEPEKKFGKEVEQGREYKKL